ncbi:hypothetical protein Tco_1511608, partial [Tanacetum coccineum]
EKQTHPGLNLSWFPRIIRAVNQLEGSFCRIANLAISQLGKFSGGGGRSLSMGELGLQGKSGVENP